MCSEPYKVSILIPIYGVEKYIEQCARSAFSQTYRNIEYIFVNDCTPDKSIDILFSVLDQFPERKEAVKIVKHERNRGLAAARNTAIAEATGEFVYHLDSDDYIEHETIELLVDNQRKTNADIVSALTLINDKIKDDFYLEPRYSSTTCMLKDQLSKIQHHEIWNRLIRLSLYTQHKIIAIEGQNYGEGWLALSRLTYYAKSISLVERFLYHYVIHDHSLIHSAKTWSREKEELAESEKNMLALRDFFHDKELVYKNIIWQTCLSQIFYRMMRSIEKADYSFFKEQHRLISTYKLKEIRLVSGIKIALLLYWPFCYQILRIYLKSLKAI